MFSGTHTTILVVVALAATLVLPGTVAGATSTIPATVDADQEASADVLVSDMQSVDENNTTTANQTTTGPPSPSEVGFGILDAERGDPGNATSILQTLQPNLAVTNIEYRDGFALVTVVNDRPRAVTLKVTDSNSIDTSGGSGTVAYEEYTLPQGRFEVKVPASTADRGSDQTITIGVGENLYWFSNDTSGGDGLLKKVGAGWVPWVLGGATMLTYMVGVAYVVLAGEQTGVREAGGTI